MVDLFGVSSPAPGTTCKKAVKFQRLNGFFIGRNAPPANCDLAHLKKNDWRKNHFAIGPKPLYVIGRGSASFPKGRCCIDGKSL